MTIKWNNRLRDKYSRIMSISAHHRLAELYRKGKLDFTPSDSLVKLLKVSAYKAIGKLYRGPR
jgi:hypothetical protein